ncbi:MAG TPA: hypothetical protein VF331_13470 [Polyangiales bacterium]
MSVTELGASGSGAAAASQPEALQAALRAYELGDFASVRRLTAPLVAAAGSEHAEAARQLRARVSVDPIALGVLSFAFALMCVIVYVYVP